MTTSSSRARVGCLPSRDATQVRRSSRGRWHLRGPTLKLAQSGGAVNTSAHRPPSLGRHHERPRQESGRGRQAISSGKVIDNSLTGSDVVDRSIGEGKLKSQVFESNSQTVEAGQDGNVSAVCPPGYSASKGTGYWEFTSGRLSGIRILGHRVTAEGRNTGNASQYIAASVSCRPF